MSVLGDIVQENGDLKSLGATDPHGDYIKWRRGQDIKVCLDGMFTVEQLRAIADHLVENR